MSATPLSSILQTVRVQLVEPTARFWTDAELQEHMREGALDLWGAIIDLHQDHYLAIADDVWLRANAVQLTGVPANLFRVQTIEPYDVTDSGTGIGFYPRSWKHQDFRSARAQSAVDPNSGQVVFYQLSGVGAPINAPTILTAPKLSADLRLRIAYNPTLEWDAKGVNPIPGESDRALVNYTLAFARAKESEQRMPDAAWLTLYEQEKAKILVRLTPRQEQEPEVVEDFFSSRYQEN